MEGQKKSNKGWMKWHFLESNSSKRGPWFAKNTILHGCECKQWWNISLINIAPVNWLLVNSQMGCVWSAMFQFNFSRLPFTWLTSQWLTISPLTSSFEHGVEDVFFSSSVGPVTHSSSLLQDKVRKSWSVPLKRGFRPALYCCRAASEHSSSSSVLMVCGCLRCQYLHRVEWSEICSPVNRGVKPNQTRSPFMRLSICLARSFTL